MNDTENPAGEKTCLECQLPLGAGRSDRKFCNDICRTAYNNRRRMEILNGHPVACKTDAEQWREEMDEKQVRQIVQILYNNRIKLVNMIGNGDFSIALQDFYGYNVNLKYFTSEYKDKERSMTFRMCFDHGYHIAEERVYLIYCPQEIYNN